MNPTTSNDRKRHVPPWPVSLGLRTARRAASFAHRRPGVAERHHLCRKVRANLLKARSALSCCGILTDPEILDSVKQKPADR